MEHTYTINWCEKKTTTTGKEKLDATLQGPDGTLIERVTIWADFPNFATIMNGGSVTGTLSPAKDPKYGPTLYPPRPTTSPKAGNFKSMQMEKVMDKKNESIAHFQGEKEMSIRIASTFRAASEMAVAEYQESHRLSTSGPTLEQLFDKWREWLWMHYEVKATDYPPTL